MDTSAPVFDHVIVGAGTAGCLLANRLSADPTKRVLLIEAGGSDRYHWVHIPVGYLYCIDNPRTDWRFRTEAEPGLNGRSLIYPRGKVLGGCSSINGMIYMRGQAADYDAWADATGSDEWRWANVLPDFMRHEHHWRLDAGAAAAVPPPGASAFLDPGQAPARSGATADHAAFHGHGGEWRVERQRLRWDILDAFALAARQSGIPASDDFNRGSNEGVGYFEVNQRGGFRWNTTRAFLNPVRRRPNLTVWTGAQASRLVIERDAAGGGLRCSGVELVRGGQRITVRAAREVVLASGAIGTPQLLQLSGIGPGALLQRHGIAVQLDAPGVGANLQDHLQIRAVYRISGAKTLNRLANTWWGKAAIALEYAFKRSGPMSMAPSQLGIFTKSDPGQARPNIQFHVQPLSLPAFGQPLHAFPAITASVCNLAPSSRGHVQITSADFTAAPSIAPNYLATEDDRRVAADSIRAARRIVAQPAMQAYRPEEFKPGAALQSDDDLARAAGDIASTIFHPVGTAQMGRDGDPLAVLDARLRVRGVAGLRVADASVMPTITRGNTNSPTLMIAEKAARWIAADAR